MDRKNGRKKWEGKKHTHTNSDWIRTHLIFLAVQSEARMENKIRGGKNERTTHTHTHSRKLYLKGTLPHWVMCCYCYFLLSFPLFLIFSSKKCFFSLFQCSYFLLLTLSKCSICAVFRYIIQLIGIFRLSLPLALPCCCAYFLSLFVAVFFHLAWYFVFFFFFACCEWVHTM